MKKLKAGVLVLALSILQVGCTGLWDAISIGKTNTKAEEIGMDYADTGVVADPYFLYKNRGLIRQDAVYPNAKCRDARLEAMLVEEE